MIRVSSLALLILVLISYKTFSQWTQLPGKGTHWCIALHITDSALIAATQDSNIMRSTDQGATWLYSNDGIQDSLYVRTLYGDNTNVFLGSNKGGYRSTDGGKSWRKINAGASGPRYVYAYFAHKGFLFMGGDSGVFRSSDQGETWESANLGIPPKTTVRAFAADDQYFYIGTARQGVFRSSDAGEHWETRSSGMLPNVIIGALWAGDGYMVAFLDGGSWFRSTDRGGSWELKSTRVTPSSGVVRVILPLEHVIVCGTEDGVARSDDYGATWQDLRIDAPTRVDTRALSIQGSYIYAGTLSHWIWRRPLSEILPPAGVGEHAAPYALRLNQSIPNPTALVTEISYSLPNYTPVSLKLYNAMMQEVSTLVDESQEGGEHHASLDVSGLPSGVYYYCLSAGTSSLTRRMVVMK